MTKRAKKVHYSKKIRDFICDKLADGYTVAEICDRKWKDEMPSSNTVYRWASKHPEFHDQLTSAYDLFFMRKVEELEYISSTDSKILYPNIDDARERFEARRSRIDTLKFLTGKMAPMFSGRFDKAQKVEHSGEVGGPNIVIQSYAIEEKTGDKDGKNVYNG